MKKIMIVEDEMLIAMGYAAALINASFDVPNVIINTGEEAVKTILSVNPDLVLMDINLKGEIDGIDAAKQILKKKNVPIIFMSGNDDAETKKRALSINPAGYLNKPINQKKMIAQIRIILTLQELQHCRKPLLVPAFYSIVI